ncbi:ATP-grasp domain-containing protein [Desulfosporosinus burensis]
MEEFNILFTSAGRRVALVRHFKKILNELRIVGKVVVADLQSNAPTRFIADGSVLVPPVANPSYVESILRACKDYNIQMVVPLIDPELGVLAEHKEQFRKMGVRLLVSSKQVNDICFDKRNTSRFLQSIGVETPRISDANRILEDNEGSYPYFVKPACGSGSIGATRVNNRAELEFYMKHVPEAIIQEFVPGEEYTIDVLVDFEGKVRCAVPRLRIETRAGEVSKGMTVKDPEIIEQSIKIVSALPGALGCITLQCIRTVDNQLKFIEINPRFGGGFPLAIEAGADFPKWIIQLLRGSKVNIEIDEWDDGIVMLRYDDAVFVRKEDIL